MTARQLNSLLAELQLVNSLAKLTPEERRKEVRRQMYVELRAVERERRQKVALEESHREKLKNEKLQWKEVMMVEDEPRRTSSALQKEQHRRQEEAELRRKTRPGDKISLTPDLKAEKQQFKKKTLYNNWVGQQTDSKPVKKQLHLKDSTYLLFAAKAGPKPEEKASENLPWLQRKLKAGLDKCRDHAEKQDKKRERKAQEQYANWADFKARRASLLPLQYDCYTAGFGTGRNSIKKSFF